MHWEYGYAIFSKLLGLKLVVLGLSFYFNSQYRRNEFYYYRNAGLSKKILWTSTAAIDVLLFLLLITKMPLRK